MKKNNMIYKCSVCGNVIAINHFGGGKLVCCNKEMFLLDEKIKDGANEKHLPVLTKIDDNTYKVVVGEVEHPMTEEHYIEYIEVLTDKNERLTSFIKDKPEAIFKTENKIVSVSSYCNLHGLWTLNIK